MAERLSPIEQVRRRLRPRHHSIRTEAACAQRVKRFVLFRRKRRPAETGSDEIGHFLPHLATDRAAVAATRNRAPRALPSLYREAPGIELPYVAGVERATRRACIPVVLTREGADCALPRVGGAYGLTAGLL